MLNRANVHIVGIVPLLMHSGALVNPMNPWVIAMKRITGKRKKTEADLIELSRLEFMGGMYLDASGEPCIPGTTIDGFFGEAAKSIRKGRQGKAGVSCNSEWPLIYDGPRDPNVMWESGRFSDIRGVKLQGKKIMRSRPVFNKWALKFEIFYDTSILSLEDIKEILQAGERTHGLGDYLPRFGRFVVKSIDDLGSAVAA